MSSISWSTRQWIKNLVLLNSHHLHFLFHYQHLNHLPLLHNLLLPNSCKQANQNGIIGCLLDMRTLILSLCSRSRKKMSSQLQHYPVDACDANLPPINTNLQHPSAMISMSTGDLVPSKAPCPCNLKTDELNYLTM